MTAPLDLRAVEAHFKVALEGDDVSGTDMAALLAHCRALRAALRTMLSTAHDVDMDGVHRGFFEPDRPACEACAAKDQAATVLAQATDEPTKEIS